MPRKARLDAPGTLHHVMVRGIERRRIVNDVADRKNFVKRLGELSVATNTSIYAWALLTNHIHLNPLRAKLVKSLIRSLGGWSAVKALRRAGDRELSDERILGSGEFVEQIIKEAEGKVKYQLPVKEKDRKIEKYITKLCKNAKVSKKELRSGSRRKEVSGVRSLIAIELVKKHGVTLAEVARRVGVSTTAVSKIIKRTRQ
jgi:hypothetical protein